MQYQHIILISIIFFSLTFNSHGQEAKDTSFKWHSNNIFKVNAVGLIFKFQSFSYERVISDKFSAMVSYGNGRTKIISDRDNTLYGQ